MGSHINDAPRRRPRLSTFGAIAVMAIAVIASGVVYMKFQREPPPTHFGSNEDHFLFGSIGTEREHGIPYWIWLVLPRIFPEHLPRAGGYAALGMVSREGSEMPAGFSRTTIGYPRVGVNCALCHTARWRERPTSPPNIVAAGPAHQTDALAYRRFLVACASDERFNAATILGEIAKNYRLSLLDRALYRFFIIPSTRRRLLALEQDDQWVHAGAQWGRGRADVINVAKFSLLRRPIDNTVGTADTVPLWNLNQRDGRALFWDGSNPSLKESVVFSTLAMGLSSGWLYDVEAGLERIQNYVATVRPPPYPFPVDQAAAQQGRTVFESSCAGCHAGGGGRAGSVIPIAEVGTDRHRVDAWTDADADSLNALGTGRDWKFSAFRKRDGYVAVPLEGVWLRGPFLHNGSVPSLADLLEPADRRPQQFWRGYDVYDPVKIGFVSSGAEAQRIGTLYDVSTPGNGNAGHVFGTELPPESKRVLLEFLKTQ